MSEEFENMLDLFRKAADKTNPLSREEKNRLQFRPPPREEDAIIQDQTSCGSFSGLVQKCLTDGAWKLTDEELEILSKGVQPMSLSSADAFVEFQQEQPADVQALIEEAFKNATDDDEQKAMLDSTTEINRRKQSKRANERFRLERQQRLILEKTKREAAARENAPFANCFDKRSSEAIQRFALKSQSSASQPFAEGAAWGFACFRAGYADDTTWDSFKTRLDSLVQKRLEYYLIPDDMRRAFKFIYIEDPVALHGGLNQKTLATFFMGIKDDEDILPRGIDHDFFFSADDIVMRAFTTGIDPLLVLHDAHVTDAITSFPAFPGYSGTTVIYFFMNTILGIERNRNHLRNMHELLYGG